MSNSSSSPGPRPAALDTQTVLRPTFHHVNISTTRLQEMIDWYALVVGMRINHRAQVSDIQAAWMSNDSANHRFAVLERPTLTIDPDKESHTGLRHTAFEYTSVDELLGTYARLRERGIVPDYCRDHGVTISFYYKDPDGNHVELQVDRFGDWNRSTEYMQNDPEFESDPVGALIDPAALLDARLAGATLEELHERGWTGEFAPAGEADR